MAQSNICIRMDEELKKQFDYLCNEFGLTMSTAINMFVKTVVRENRIPLELSLDTPNSITKKAIEDVEKGIRKSIPYTNANEVIQSILKDTDEY